MSGLSDGTRSILASKRRRTTSLRDGICIILDASYIINVKLESLIIVLRVVMYQNVSYFAVKAAGKIALPSVFGGTSVY